MTTEQLNDMKERLGALRRHLWPWRQTSVNCPGRAANTVARFLGQHQKSRATDEEYQGSDWVMSWSRSKRAEGRWWRANKIRRRAWSWSMKLPLLSSKEICRFLEREGFECIRQKGSHRFYRHVDGRSTVVPMHTNKDIGRGLLLDILEDIKLDRDAFLKKYNT